MDLRCKDCVFFSLKPNSTNVSDGLCRRKSPEGQIIVTPKENLSLVHAQNWWPPVDGSLDWCGEGVTKDDELFRDLLFVDKEGR